LITVDIIRLEGMAMNGLIKEVALRDCSKPPSWKKIVAIDINGNVIETSCIEPDAAKRNLTVLLLYTKRWGHIINEGGEVEGPPEED